MAARPTRPTPAQAHLNWIQANVFQQSQHQRAKDAVAASTKMTSPTLLALVGGQPLRKTVVRIEEADTFASAKALHELYPTDNIAVLNMANARTPGGGFLGGSRAQEEDLCHCSTLYPTLRQALYPMQPNQLIYSPDVLVTKQKATRGHQDLSPDEWFYVDVISCAAVQGPRTEVDEGTNETVYSRDGERILMASKIRWILNAAVRNNVQRLVLGAFGCGVFGNPPREVAKMMKTILIGDDDDHGPGTDWASHGLLEIVIAIFDPATTQPNLNGFINVWREEPLPYGVAGMPQPELIQYTTFPPEYRGVADDDLADDSLFNSVGLTQLLSMSTSVLPAGDDHDNQIV